MIQFILAFALFLALHSVPAIPAIRQGLVARLGRRLYLALYSIASIASLGWVFQSALALDYLELWPPAAWQAWLSLVLVPIAMVLLIAGLASSNPLSITFRRGSDRPGAIIAITRHPVLWGFVLWAASHVLANGDVRSLMLFGALGLFAVFGMVMTDRRNRRRLGPDWTRLSETSSVLPLAAMLAGRSRLRLDLPLGIGIVGATLITAWLLLGGHAALFGADPLVLATS